jgi:hypothetical protein
MNNAALFIVTYLGLIAIGTLVVGGWFFITRGEKITLPDGSIQKKGKIFRDWYFYFTQELPAPKQIYFKGKELKSLVKKLNPYFNNLVTVHEGAVSILNDKDFKEKNVFSQVQEDFNIRFWPKGDGYYAIYREYPDYVFPEWVRYPMAVCATCFSSVYGSFFYWSTYPFIGKHLYSWMEMPILASVIFWIVFCFSLSIPLTALAKKYN